MINLLPPTIKQEIRAARTNVILLRITALLTTSLVFMLVTFGAGFFFTMRDKQQADDIKKTQTAATSQYADVKERAAAFASNLNAAKTILNGQISYTTLLIKLANSLPAGTALSTINITDANFGKSITLTAGAKNYDAVLKLKSSLSDSGILSNVGIVSIQDSADPKVSYPLQLTLSGQLTAKPPIISEGAAP